MYYAEPRGPSAEEKRLTDVVTHVAGIAIERQRSEELLRQSEQRYRALVTASAQHVWRTNEQGESLFVNAAWLELTGQNEHETHGFGWTDVLRPDDRTLCQQLWKQALLTKSLYESEFRVRTREGEYRVFESRGVPILDPDGRVREWVGTNTDVTERKKAEKARLESDAQNRATLRAIPDLMFLLSNDGVYLDCHLKSPDQILLPPDQLLGKSMSDVLPPELVKEFSENFRKASDLDEPQTLEYELSVNGKIRHSEARIVRSGGDKFLIIVRDVSERKRAETALRKSEEDLRRSHEQIRELAGRLLTAQEEERRRISRELHDDLSQKVAALSISLSRIKRQLNGPVDSIISQLENVQSCTHELSDGIRQLSHQLHPALLEHSGLPAALTSFVTEFSRLEEIDVKLTVPNSVAIPQELALCLYRVAQESLRNIVKHSGAKCAELTLSVAPGVVRLVVSDQGRGFDPDLRRRGGLGLVSMEERVRLVHGSIDVSSLPGVGTTVVATIPLTTQ